MRQTHSAVWLTLQRLPRHGALLHSRQNCPELMTQTFKNAVICPCWTHQITENKKRSFPYVVPQSWIKIDIPFVNCNYNGKNLSTELLHCVRNRYVYVENNGLITIKKFSETRRDKSLFIYVLKMQMTWNCSVPELYFIYKL